MRIYYALTHVASQLLYRWLPFPVDHAFSREEDLPDLKWDLENCSENNFFELFLELINAERQRTYSRLPWLNEYIRRYDPEGSRLAQTAETYFLDLRRVGGAWICPLDPEYPPMLALIADPPVGLGILGNLSILSYPLISVVGSRKASAWAMRQSFELGRQLALSGIAVVSGGAFGCDIAAHHGVLSAQKDPALAVCVFAGGLDCLYPKGNDVIFRRLREREAVLVSERLWRSPCFARDFHARNRIIAGMSGLTVVMQASQASGALVTARLASDFGRDLAVLSHPLGDVRALGSSELIADGAYSFASSQVLVDQLSDRHFSEDANSL